MKSKKSFRRLAALLLGVLMAASFSLTAYAAVDVDVDNPPLDIDPIVLPFVLETTKTVVVPEGANAPAENYFMHLEPAEVDVGATEQNGKINVYPGITEGVYGIDFPFRMNADRTSGNGFIDFGSVNFPAPGIYRYVLSESAGDTADMEYDDTEYIVDVYVGTVNMPELPDIHLKSLGPQTRDAAAQTYADIDVEGPKVDIDTPDVAIGDLPDGYLNVVEGILVYNSDKTEKTEPSFTNTFTPHDLSIEKTVTGNQADYSKSFKFNLVIESDAPFRFDMDLPIDIDIPGLGIPELKSLNPLSTIVDEPGVDDSGEPLPSTLCLLPGGSVLTGQIIRQNGTIEDVSVTVSDFGAIDAEEGNTEITVTPFEFELAHGDKLVITGIPQGVKYHVEEVKSEDDGSAIYDTTVKEGNGEAVTSDTFDKTMDGEGDAVTFINDKSSTVPTGVLLTVAPFALLAVAGVVFLVIKVRKKAGAEA